MKDFNNQIVLKHINDHIAQNGEELDSLALKQKEAQQEADMDDIMKSDAWAFENPSKLFPVIPADPDLFKSPYHDYTVITPQGITQTTVIDNN